MMRDLPSIDELVVHRPPMLLLDAILSLTDSEVVAEAHVRASNPFFEQGRGLPAYVGLEMMAQAIAALDGEKRRNSGRPAKIGFLLGCRRYVSEVSSFAEETRLMVRAKMVFEDSEMLSFDCSIENSNGALAMANLKVYGPADPLAFLKQTQP
jgi:predicted hotdog family 3-hydroxylacyl-ACP dehydratase